VTSESTAAYGPAASKVRPGSSRAPLVGWFGTSPRVQRLTDFALVGVVLLFATPGIFSGAHDRHGGEVLLTLVMVLPLLVRRRWPAAVFAVIATAAFVQWLMNAQLPSDVALLVAFYTVAAYESWRQVIACAAVLELGIVLASVRWSHNGSSLLLVVLLNGMAVAAGVLGLNVRTRRAYLDSLRDRAERLERERDQQAEIAAAAERARIAREMHDVVAHHLTVMTSLADGARYALAQRPDQASDALAAVSKTGRSALSDMRALLGVLAESSSDEPSATTPQPGLDGLARLAIQVTDAGLPVSLKVSDANGDPVPQGLQLVAYRVVQEALTNALKHAGRGARANVDVRVDGATLEVQVIDREGTPAIRPYGAERAEGRGLAGMRERVAVYRGDVEAGPLPQGGWRVHAVLPRTEDDS
jgi:signal transduction histidine kinase